MSIYDEIGGRDAVHAAVDRFYERVWADEALSPFFVSVDRDRLKAHQRSFIAAALGGPEVFAGRPMDQAHAGLTIADTHFDRVVEHLVATLTELGVPEPTIGTIGETLLPLRAQIVTG